MATQAYDTIMSTHGSPDLIQEFQCHTWQNIPSHVHTKLNELRKLTCHVFHDSTLYFAMSKGLEVQVRNLAFTAIARNQCSIIYNGDKDEGELTDAHVGEGILTQLIEFTDSDQKNGSQAMN